ncbi:hypothetical protein [Mesorhizobium sp. B4-1-1]|uniref:hypothetical protein n=1 Tax=Mesorhizobium sp. B4-1-1 TaxID=2589890 RepID=UPI00112E38CC|nr:hypothetical protein [Mesorhizobium sp. B4-1-1]TPI21339.1 hypothetical protein FJW10_07085 [Mesorhizobium sp. B4-1-1]
MFEFGTGLGQSRQDQVQLAHGDGQRGAARVGRYRDRLAEQDARAFGAAISAPEVTVTVISSLPPISTKEIPLSVRRGTISVKASPPAALARCRGIAPNCLESRSQKDSWRWDFSQRLPVRSGAG